MSKKGRAERRRKEVLDNLTNISHPIRNSIFIAVFWVLMIFILSIILVAINQRAYLYNINLVSFIGIAIAIIWYGFYWGFAEKAMLYFHNNRNKQFGKFYKEDIPKVDVHKYREWKKQKSLIGTHILLTVMITIMIITILIQQV